MYTDHIVSAINHHELVQDSTLHVIGVCSNPVRYHSRYRLFREWAEATGKSANVKLYLVEAAFGDRHHEVTSSSDPSHLQLRTGQELWHKENMINLGVRLLPRDWKYVAWVDADVFFGNSNWALETLHALQHHPLVQPWSECADMGPNGNILAMFSSFGSLSAKGVRIQSHSTEPYKFGHSGYAWACTRRFWEETGGLMDFPILGSADAHMAWAAAGKVDLSIHGKMSDTFKRRCREWQDKALRLTHGRVGYVPGMLSHKFHGPKGRRYYRERWQILVDHKFDPDKDLGRDDQGLLYVVGKPNLQFDISRYMSSRHEDSIDES